MKDLLINPKSWYENNQCVALCSFSPKKVYLLINSKVNSFIIKMIATENNDKYKTDTLYSKIFKFLFNLWE